MPMIVLPTKGSKAAAHKNTNVETTEHLFQLCNAIQNVGKSLQNYFAHQCDNLINTSPCLTIWCLSYPYFHVSSMLGLYVISAEYVLFLAVFFQSSCT